MIYLSAVIDLTRLYLIRHCEALGNVKRIFQGSTDLDISETGAKQLECLKKRFLDTEIDAVFSSPLLRARKTAHAVADQKGLPVIPIDGLAEIHGGIVEGKPFAETFGAMPELADAWDNRPEDFAPEGGEPMRAAYERIWNTVLDIARKNEGKSIAVATHGGVLRCLNCRLLHGDISNLKDTPWCDNTAVNLIEFDGGLNPQVVYINDISHLPKELIIKRNRLSSFMKGEKQ